MDGGYYTPVRVATDNARRPPGQSPAGRRTRYTCTITHRSRASAAGLGPVKRATYLRTDAGLDHRAHRRCALRRDWAGRRYDRGGYVKEYAVRHRSRAGLPPYGSQPERSRPGPVERANGSGRLPASSSVPVRVWWCVPMPWRRRPTILCNWPPVANRDGPGNTRVTMSLPSAIGQAPALPRRGRRPATGHENGTGHGADESPVSLVGKQAAPLRRRPQSASGTDHPRSCPPDIVAESR